jgi:peptidoglycan/xylan/chitin deacetylase (PgdA/CDA1 family)
MTEAKMMSSPIARTDSARSKLAPEAQVAQPGIRVRWGAVLGGVAGMALACSGPDLRPTAEALPPPNTDVPLVLPPGSWCAPERLDREDALPVQQAGKSEAAQQPACEGTPPPASEHTPLRPLGFGYQDGGSNPIPNQVAYLTFDDGPSEWTAEFLDILAEKGVKATFFVTAKQLKGDLGLDGSFIDEAGNTVIYRDLIARIANEGHQLANHTVNHPDIARITRAQVTSEIEQNELLVNRALVRAGALPQLLPLFRPPYGSPWYTGIVEGTPPRASERISSHGLNIMWNITSSDAADWATGESYSATATPVPTPNAPSYAAKVARIRASVLESSQLAAGEGFIVLMHDTHNATRDALPEMIDGVAAAGYTFETVEHYVNWRWGRASTDMTPGPHLYDPCIEERHWGCEAFGAPLGADRSLEVCGRMWLAYEALRDSDIGRPVAAPVVNPETHILSQAFERAIIELHPENEAPCNVIAIPQ